MADLELEDIGMIDEEGDLEEDEGADANVTAGDNVAEGIYRRIVAFFAANRYEVVQIELLPPLPLPPDGIFTEGTSLGIPKPSLHKAFLYARHLFFSTLPLHKATPTLETAETLLDTSLVMLLFDSEHLTALNTRRRILLAYNTPRDVNSPSTGGGGSRSGSRSNSPMPSSPPNFHFQSPSTSTTSITLPPGFRRSSTSSSTATKPAKPTKPPLELLLLNSFFSSPLHRHTKSPNLWSYRKWLVVTYPGLKIVSGDRSGRRWARKEAQVVLRAAETHPKNYYAWSYARHLMEVHGVGCGNEELLSWCLKRPSDVSAWTFLGALWMWQVGGAGAGAGGGTKGDTGMGMGGLNLEGGARADIDQYFNQLLLVLKYSHNTAPGHESIWLFVGTVVASNIFDPPPVSKAPTTGILSMEEKSPDYKRQILAMLKEWDSEEGPAAGRAAEDILKERKLVRALLVEMEAKLGVEAPAEKPVVGRIIKPMPKRGRGRGGGSSGGNTSSGGGLFG